MTDSHYPGEYHVNSVLRNIPEFYRAYNVQPGDKTLPGARAAREDWYKLGLHTETEAQK